MSHSKIEEKKEEAIRVMEWYLEIIHAHGIK